MITTAARFERPPFVELLQSNASQYIGTGAYNGQVRVLIHTQRWTGPSPTPFSTWGNLLALVYDAP